MRRLLILGWLILATMPALAEAQFTATVAQVIGVTRVERSGTITALRAGFVLQASDRILVDKGSCFLNWPDGTRCKLTAGARMTLQQAKGTTAVTNANLEQGECWFNVTKYARRPARFEINTGRTTGAVEGTQVRYAFDAQSQVSCIEVWTGVVQCTIHHEGMTKPCRKVGQTWVHSHNQKNETVWDHGTMVPMPPDPWQGPVFKDRDPRSDPDMDPWPSGR